MKKYVLLFSLLFPLLACAGAYEDMEEALIRRDSSAVIELIKRGVDINTVDRDGNSLLIQAVRRDVPELFDYLLQRRARVNSRNKHGETALSIASFSGKMVYVERLVQAGAEVNFFGWAPLTYAAFNGHVQIADYLLKQGAEINARSGIGSTALFYAARFGHIKIIELLLENKADPKIVNEDGDTAVDWALKSENTDIANLLRAAGGRSGKSVVIELSK